MLMRKAHVKAYEKTGPAGQPVPVREHEDKRPAATLRSTVDVGAAAKAGLKKPAPLTTAWWKQQLPTSWLAPKAGAAAARPEGPVSQAQHAPRIPPGPSLSGFSGWELPPSWKPSARPPIPASGDPAKQVLAFSPFASETPKVLNGVPFEPFAEPADWAEYTDGLKPMPEPPLTAPPGKEVAAGVIMVEPDGRVWVVEPTDHFGAIDHTFPKGRLEPGLSPQQAALKEGWEESGLKAEILAHLGDYERSTTTTRYYLAKRTGGQPWMPTWETQGTKLVPPEYLESHFLNQPVDHTIARHLQAKLATARMFGGGDWERGLAQLQSPEWTMQPGEGGRSPRVRGAGP